MYIGENMFHTSVGVIYPEIWEGGGVTVKTVTTFK